jgi:hypothetical protein
VIFIKKIDIMEIIKKVDLGEYIVVINYEDTTGSLVVTVLDELEEEIESLEITNDEDEDNEDPFDGLLN